MPLAEQKLNDISGQIKQGVVPQKETARSFLLWFGAARRGYRIVAHIREVLDRHGLVTVPDFEYAYIDGLIGFECAKDSDLDHALGAGGMDPTYRIGRLESANRAPVCVKPDTALQEAVTVMLANDFSQLPVITGPRGIKGVISWRTIGARLALKRDCQTVHDCTESAHVVTLEESLFEAISKISAHDYVLVQAVDGTLCGIITASDFSEQFRNLAEPFLLVGEIENGLRQMMHGKFSVRDLEAARSPGNPSAIERIADLTLGECVRLLEEPKRWKKLKLEIDRVTFIARLDKAREIRNDIMHFDPEGLEVADIELLRDFAQFLKLLREMGAV